MQLSREGSGCVGRCHHRHHHHRSPPADTPTIDSTNPAPHRRSRNSYDYAKSGGRRYRGSVGSGILLLGSGSVTEGGVRRSYRRGRRQAGGGERRTTTLRGAEAIRKGTATALPEEPTAGVTNAAVTRGQSGGVTGEGESRDYRRVGVSGGNGSGCDQWSPRLPPPPPPSGPPLPPLLSPP